MVHEYIYTCVCIFLLFIFYSPENLISSLWFWFTFFICFSQKIFSTFAITNTHDYNTLFCTVICMYVCMYVVRKGAISISYLEHLPVLPLSFFLRLLTLFVCLKFLLLLLLLLLLLPLPSSSSPHHS